MNHASFLLAAVLVACVHGAPSPKSPPLASDAQILAAQNTLLDSEHAAWNARVTPFNVVGNIYYVGAANVSSYLITGQDGHFLIDGGFAQTAPQIIENIAALGFNIRDVKYLLNTHAHYDHFGGLAALQRASGATVLVSAADRDVLERGYVEYGPSAGVRAPPIRADRVIADGDRVTIGNTTLIAYVTPGHTPGCTSWAVGTHGADGASHRAFFHCSSTVGGQSLAPPAYPGIVEDFRRTFARMRTIEADVLLPNHAMFTDLLATRERQIAGDANAFVDAGALQRFNAEMEQAFEDELARQTSVQR